MVKGLEVFQLIRFYYTIIVTLYAVPKYLYLLKKKTIVIFPIFLFCSSIMAGIIIIVDLFEFYILRYFYEEITGGVMGWIIVSSVCFVIYNFCYWIMTTLYIDVKSESIVVHSIFFSKVIIERKDIVFSESYFCCIPKEFNVNETLLISLKNGKKYKLGFDPLTHCGNVNLLLEWFKKSTKLTDEKKYKKMKKTNQYKSLTFKIF